MSDNKYNEQTGEKKGLHILTEEELFGKDRQMTDIELGMLQMQILWLLSRKSNHGYSLMKDLSIIKGKKITAGTLYPTLQKLVEAGYVKRKEYENTIIYDITKKGSAAMHEACLDFCRTFYGIYQDFVCKTCIEHQK